MKVVFLDIDGVVQPHTSFKRFDYMKTNIVEELSRKYCVDYSKYSDYDVCAVYADWEKSAVDRLKYILDYTNSSIIISSNWRDPTKQNKMKDLLKIQGLDKYWFQDNPLLRSSTCHSKNRAIEINTSLNKYDISYYVVLDDMGELVRYFPDNFVCTKKFIQDEDVDKCIKILKRK